MPHSGPLETPATLVQAIRRASTCTPLLKHCVTTAVAISHTACAKCQPKLQTALTSYNVLFVNCRSTHRKFKFLCQWMFNQKYLIKQYRLIMNANNYRIYSCINLIKIQIMILINSSLQSQKEVNRAMRHGSALQNSNGTLFFSLQALHLVPSMNTKIIISPEFHAKYYCLKIHF